MIYLDTSALVPLYLEEPLSKKVQKAIAAMGTPAVTPLSEVEFVSAVARRVLGGDLSPDNGRRVMSQFQGHLDEGFFTRLDIDVVHFARARDLIGRFTVPLRTLDAIHLCVTERNGLILITADQSLAKAAKSFGVEVKLLNA